MNENLKVISNFLDLPYDSWKITNIVNSPYTRIYRLSNICGKNYYYKTYADNDCFHLEKSFYFALNGLTITPDILYSSLNNKGNYSSFILLGDEGVTLSCLLRSKEKIELEKIFFLIGCRLATFHNLTKQGYKFSGIPYLTFSSNIENEIKKFIFLLSYNKKFIFNSNISLIEKLLERSLKIYNLESKELIEFFNIHLDNIKSNIDQFENIEKDEFLVHGDFWRENILIDYKNSDEINVKLIDFLDTHIGDRRMDLIRFYSRGCKFGPYNCINDMKPQKSYWNKFTKGYNSIEKLPDNLFEDHSYIKLHDLLKTTNYYLDESWNNCLNTTRKREEHFSKIFRQLICLVDLLINDISNDR